MGLNFKNEKTRILFRGGGFRLQNRFTADRTDCSLLGDRREDGQACISAVDLRRINAVAGGADGLETGGYADGFVDRVEQSGYGQSYKGTGDKALQHDITPDCLKVDFIAIRYDRAIRNWCAHNVQFA
jgi:hypothetical protein